MVLADGSLKISEASFESDVAVSIRKLVPPEPDRPTRQKTGAEGRNSKRSGKAAAYQLNLFTRMDDD